MREHINLYSDSHRFADIATAHEDIRRPNIHEPRSIFLDYLGRDIEPGDIVAWSTEKYYSNSVNYGLVLFLNHERRFIKIRNQNKNKITKWNLYNMVILAKEGNYNIIPERIIRQLGIDTL